MANSETVKQEKLSVRDISYIGMFAVIIAISSWISIPTAVPFTMQTFGISAALAVLGGKRGTYAVLTYLLLGGIGVPVFAEFTGGLGILLCSTGGYLTGFLFMAVIYTVITSKLGTSVPVTAAAMAAGLAVMYLFGTMQYVWFYSKNNETVGFLTALGFCVVPFVIPDVIKIILAMFLARRVGKIVKK